MRTKRSIKDSLKEYLNWCVGRLLLGGSRDDTVRDMVDAISDEIASGDGGVSQDQLDQTVKDVTKAYGIADQTVLTSAESYTDQKIADVVDGSPEALDTLYELAKALGDDSNFATTVMDQIGQKLPTTTFENFIDNKAWTKDNLTKLSQLINNINSIKAGTRVESMDVNLASISSYLEYDLFDNNTTGTKPPGLTTGFLLTFSWDNGGWGAQIATSDGNVDGAIFLRTIKASESDKIWGPWVSLYNTANFNPDNYLPKTTPTINSGTVINGLSNVGNLPFLRFHIPGVNYSQFVMDENGTVHLLNGSEQTPGAYKPLKAGPIFSNGNRVWDSGNFKPDDKFGFSAAQLSDLNNAPNNAFFVGAHNAVNAPVADSWSNGFTIAYGNNPDFPKQFCYAGDKWWTRGRDGVNWGTWRQIWDSGSFNPDNKFGLSGIISDLDNAPLNAVFSTNGTPANAPLENAYFQGFTFAMDSNPQFKRQWALKDGEIWFRSMHAGTYNGWTKVVGQASSTYIFPGDPSELDSSSSSTHIASILGTASDFLDAFNNGKVFVSKTVTFSGVSVPSDITYNVLKSEDPDNPTIFQIIMSTVVRGHYMEITIDFENNEYQAISNTINGIIGVNNTGTTN